MSVVAKRVLVTGGAGFLGSHLCERLLARGDDVLCVDNHFAADGRPRPPDLNRINCRLNPYKIRAGRLLRGCGS
jgi:nucleoside-diphosphate-sugar epimerase